MERDTSLKASAMIVTEYRMRLKNKQDLGGGKTAFYFEKPPGFEFKAGQYVDITLINPPQTDPDGDIRSFSIASEPSEEHLLIVTRVRDTAFKRALQDLPYGTEVEVEGPFGRFTLPTHPTKPAIFLAGGIGIAPFSSMILSAAREGFSRDLYLFYSNPRPEDTAFLQRFQELEKKNASFRFVPTMTETGKTHHSWTGETGLICSEMLLRYVPRLQGPIYYLAGSPGFVAAMQKMLKGAGVGENDVRCEEFVGY
jgi:ferredoxin-NADP reductase